MKDINKAKLVIETSKEDVKNNRIKLLVDIIIDLAQREDQQLKRALMKDKPKLEFTWQGDSTVVSYLRRLKALIYD